MSGTRTTAAVMAAVAALALPLAGCGKEKPKIPSSDARELIALLQTVQRQTGAHACTTVEQTIASLERRTEALPSRTDADIRSSLRDGIANLRELVASECSQVKPKPKEPTTTTETTTSEPTTTDTETTDTTDTNTNTTPDTNTNTTPDTNTDTTPDTTPSGGTPPGQLKKGQKGKKK
jgi:hypothetical protein